MEQAELVSATLTLSWSWRERDARSVARASVLSISRRTRDLNIQHK
jgi:hypothetical protein